MTSNNAGVYKCSSESVLTAGTTVFVGRFRTMGGGGVSVYIFICVCIYILVYVCVCVCVYLFLTQLFSLFLCPNVKFVIPYQSFRRRSVPWEPCLCPGKL